jgi:hypothetical protein
MKAGDRFYSGPKMHEHGIEEVHELLDTLEALIPKIDRLPTKNVQIQQVPELSEVVLVLLNWTNTAYMENRLGIQPHVLNKFVKMRGVVSKNVALRVADRLRSYLKGEDQAFAPSVQSDGDDSATPPSSVSTRDTSTIEIFAGEQWVVVRSTSEIKLKISAVSTLLDSIIVQVRGANEPPDELALSEIDRRQLIAILETALSLLKSPMVEKGLLKKAGSLLQKGAEKAMEKGAQEGLGKLMEGAASRLAELIGLLFS